MSIIVDLNNEPIAAISHSALADLMLMRKVWPDGATCATQEIDGEIIYWNAPVEEVKVARGKAKQGDLTQLIGIKHQIDAWYTDDDKPQLAEDWDCAVVTPEILLFSYLNALYEKKLSFDEGVALASEWTKKVLKGEVTEETDDGTDITILKVGSCAADCFIPIPDGIHFYYEA